MNDAVVFLPDKWVDNYADELYRYTLSRVKDEGIAEDLVQETFLSAWKARDTYRGLASEKTWLYAICKNKIVDHIRKRGNRAVVSTLEEEHLYFDAVEHWKPETTPREWNINYGEPMESREFYLVLNQCKGKLKEVQQHVFAMKYMEEMEADHICETLNITSANYWVLLHRCKLHLRSCLEKNWLNII